MQLDLPYVVLDAYSVLSQFDAVGQDVCNFLRASRNSVKGSWLKKGGLNWDFFNFLASP